MKYTSWLICLVALVGLITVQAWAEKSESDNQQTDNTTQADQTDQAEASGKTDAANQEQHNDKDKDKESKAEKRKAPKFRLWPYRELISLTDEQKAQITEVHNKYVQERKKLDEAEKAEIQTLLSDQQNDEVQQILEARKAKQKEAAEKEKAAHKPAGE